MQSELLDDFRDVSGWSAVASGRAQLALSQDDGPHGKALRLDFDFRGGHGFVVARKLFARALPSRYAFHFYLRGASPPNRLEWKLVDPSGRNVWWARRENFEFPAEWRSMWIPSREIEFASGPAGGGAATQLGALELAIVAGRGGRGSVWIEDLRFEDLAYRATPIVRASSAEPGFTELRALDGSSNIGWRSAPSEPQWLSIDFGEEREVGGLVVHWEPGAGARSFGVETSADGERWTALQSLSGAEGSRSHLYTPGTTARHLRLELRERREGDRFGIREIEALPHEVSRSVTAFFQAIAKRERRGLYPRYLYSEQSYWSPVGVPGAQACALLGESGMLEVDRGSFSLEPFLFVDGELVTWADAETLQDLEQGWLPIPSSTWQAKDVRFTTTAFAAGDPEHAVLHARYRLECAGAAPRRLRLLVAARPFQVTPPWQSFHDLGGVSPIRELAYREGVLRVNGNKVVIPQDEPSGFGAAAFEYGAFTERLARGELPQRTQVSDATGLASGALCFDLELAPGSAREICITVPFGERPQVSRSEASRPARSEAQPSEDRTGLPSEDQKEGDLARLRARRAAAELTDVRDAWQRKLGKVAIRLPQSESACVDTLRTATAHILVVRDGPALQPGPRRYTRSWIRDAATMCAALLRMGCPDEVRDFLRWYAPYQAADGNVPCCVDRSGPDWLPEHDSHSQLIYIVAEHLRFSGDLALAAELWPAVLRAADYLESLRAQRLTREFAEGERRACYGILPESVSHEGYLAHPVHAYWDDFWALRGFGDAVDLALALGHGDDAARLSRTRDSLRECLHASIATTMADRHLDTLPGSVEWADFDPSASATALATTDAIECLPAAVLNRTYDQYLEGFRKRRAGELDWASYTPYEIRIIGALVRLGRRDDAHELLDAFLADRRPLRWNQWPEIAWRDPRSPGHLGDLPHAWVGAEYVLALLALFAFETDRALVLAAGVPDAWLAEGFELAVEGLPTAYGTLGYRLRRPSDDSLLLSLSGRLAPPGGIVVRPPLPRPLRRVEVDGRRVETFDAASVTLARAPATLLMRYEEES